MEMKRLQSRYTTANNIYSSCIYIFLITTMFWILGGMLVWLRYGGWGQTMTTCYFMGWSCTPVSSGFIGYDQLSEFILQSSLAGLLAIASLIFWIPTAFIRSYYAKKIRSLRPY